MGSKEPPLRALRFGCGDGRRRQTLPSRQSEVKRQLRFRNGGCPDTLCALSSMRVGTA